MRETETDWSNADVQAAAADYSRRCRSVEDAAADLGCTVVDLRRWRAEHKDDHYSGAQIAGDIPSEDHEPHHDTDAAEVIRHLLDWISPSIRSGAWVTYHKTQTSRTADEAREVPSATPIPWRRRFRAAFCDVELSTSGQIMRIPNACIAGKARGRRWEIRRLVPTDTVSNTEFIARRIACLAELVRNEGTRGTDLAQFFGDDKQRIGYIRKRLTEQLAPKSRGIRGVRHTIDPRRGVTKSQQQ